MNETKIVKVLSDDGEKAVYIDAVQVREMPERGLQPGVVPHALEKFGDIGKFIADRSDELIGQLKASASKSSPDKVTLTFGITLKAEAGVIPVIAQVGGEAAITVEVEWSKKTT
jgi:hypothetical protein